jgi:hypothetical protein
VAIDNFLFIATTDVVAIDSFDRRTTTYVVAIDLTLIFIVFNVFSDMIQTVLIKTKFLSLRILGYFKVSLYFSFRR